MGRGRGRGRGRGGDGEELCLLCLSGNGDSWASCCVGLIVIAFIVIITEGATNIAKENWVEYDRDAAKTWASASCSVHSSDFEKGFCNRNGEKNSRNDDMCYKVRHHAIVVADSDNTTSWDAPVWKYPSWTQGHKKLKAGEPGDRMFDVKKKAKRYQKKFNVANTTRKCYYDPQKPRFVAFYQYDPKIRKNFYTGIILLSIGLCPFACVCLAGIFVLCVMPCLEYLEVRLATVLRSHLIDHFIITDHHHCITPGVPHLRAPHGPNDSAAPSAAAGRVR